VKRSWSGSARSRIRAYRIAAGLTQRQLARTAGVSIGVVRDLEQGRTTRLRTGSADGLGAVLLATGCPCDARAHYDIALSLATEIGDRDLQARAHDGLGHACHATGEPSQARRHWEQAHAIYVELGVPEADAVHAQLTTV